MKHPPLLITLLLACNAAPPAPSTPTATAPPSPSTAPAATPQVLADLDAEGRRATCGRIIATRRSKCDPDMHDINAMLVDDCAADHPKWSCKTIRIDDHERCESTRDPTACAAVHSQAEACDLTAALRARCPLHVGAVVENGPAARAGLVAGDRVRTIDGEARGHLDIHALLSQMAAAPARPLRFGVESGSAPARELTVTPELRDGAPRIGVEFTPPPECDAFLRVRGPLPCRVG